MSLKLITWKSWNPITGCVKFSDGCLNCYAEAFSQRLKHMGQVKYQNGFDLTVHEKNFGEPLSWKTPKFVFLCSMSDLFQEDVSFDVIDRLFDTMLWANHHIFYVLTKRSQRLAEYSAHYGKPFPPNVWAGVTIESEKYVGRLADLRKVDAALKHIVFEPLLSAIPKLDLSGIGWAVCAGESGDNARPADPDWVRGIRDNCAEYNVPFYFKQWGGKNKKGNGNTLDGKTYDKMPRSDIANFTDKNGNLINP